MLNEPLYKAIAAVFGQAPRIINEGVTATIEYPAPIISFVDSAITPIATNRIHGGEQYTVCCPFCGDKRDRLYFSYLWGAVIDTGHVKYRCSSSLVRCFNEECQRIPANKDYIIRRLGEVLNDANLLSAISVVPVDPESDDQLSNQVPLPPNLRDIDDPLVPEYVRKYWIVERGFDVATLKKFGVKFTYLTHPVKAGAPLCQQMVTIVPVVQDGDYWFHQIRLIPINGETSRGYEKDQLGVALPKYIIPHGSRKNWALYNMDKAKFKQTIYIVEGVTDVWRIGDNAIARFGKTLSRAQLSILKSKFMGKRLVIIPDMDDQQAYEEALRQQVILQNSQAFSDVLISRLPPGADPGDLRGNAEKVQSCIEAHIVLQGGTMSSPFGNPGLLS